MMHNYHIEYNNGFEIFVVFECTLSYSPSQEISKFYFEKGKMFGQNYLTTVTSSEVIVISQYLKKYPAKMTNFERHWNRLRKTFAKMPFSEVLSYFTFSFFRVSVKRTKMKASSFSCSF